MGVRRRIRRCESFASYLHRGAGKRLQPIDTALHREPLMVEIHAAHATQFGPATSPAWPAMQTHGHDDAMTGLRLADAVIDHQNAAVMGAEAEHRIGGETRV